MQHRSPLQTSKHQQGVVLIVALIMLVIISLLASFSIRSSTSTEAVSGNVRTSQLARQAAEIALSFCASEMDNLSKGSPTTVITSANLPKFSPGTPYTDYPRAVFKNTATFELDYWDGAKSVAAIAANNGGAYPYIIPTTLLGGTSTYKRAPECMVEPIPIVQSGAIRTTVSYVITARGFGPEVAAADPATRKRPIGSEVWLQSTDE